MRLLYLGDTASPHFRAWPAEFASRAHEVHACHLVRDPPGEPIPGVIMHGPPRATASSLRGAWLAGALGVRRLWRALRPDVAHSHQIVPCGFVCELAGIAPHVSTAWGSEVLRAGAVARPLVRRTARGAALITADSRHLLAVLERGGADPARLRWVPWGVSAAWREPAATLSRPAAARRAGLPSERRLVLSHRGLGSLYRQDIFVRAIGELASEHPELLGVVVSLDPAREAAGERRLRTLIAELGLEERVLIVPRFEHALMPFAYRAAEVCVSVPESDSAPTSVFEALSVGTAAVVSDLPWVREPVHREARLEVVPVGDHRALAAALRALLSAESADDAEANRRLVERHFDRGRLFGEVEREYERLAAGAGLR